MSEVGFHSVIMLISLLSGGHFVTHVQHQGRYFIINQNKKITVSNGVQNCQIFLFKQKAEQMDYS